MLTSFDFLNSWNSRTSLPISSKLSGVSNEVAENLNNCRMTIHQEYGITIAYESFLMLQTAHALGKLETCTIIILCNF